MSPRPSTRLCACCRPMTSVQKRWRWCAWRSSLDGRLDGRLDGHGADPLLSREPSPFAWDGPVGSMAVCAAVPMLLPPTGTPRWVDPTSSPPPWYTMRHGSPLLIFQAFDPSHDRHLCRTDRTVWQSCIESIAIRCRDRPDGGARTDTRFLSPDQGIRSRIRALQSAHRDGMTLPIVMYSPHGQADGAAQPAPPDEIAARRFRRRLPSLLEGCVAILCASLPCARTSSVSGVRNPRSNQNSTLELPQEPGTLTLIHLRTSSNEWMESDGFGETQVEVSVLQRGQKAVVVQIGRQHRVAMDAASRRSICVCNQDR